MLESLYTTETVLRALGGHDSQIERLKDRYESIQNALIEAVRAVHIPWKEVPPEALTKMRNALQQYRSVYSTNYDLLIYWAIMSHLPRGFPDYFQGKPPAFSIADVRSTWSGTRILYLHGALHLYRLPSGMTAKLRWGQYQNILDQFGTYPVEGAVPLFVSEGTADDKVTAINQSGYLAFAFGQSLGSSDDHLIKAMKRWGEQPIAVSIYRRGTDTDSEEVISSKGRIKSLLPTARLRFFDARSHPLGSPNLKVG